MLNFIKNFRRDEDGAVTVDWVVLTAAIVGLGVAAMLAVSQGVNTLGGAVQADLTGANYLGKGVAPTSTGSN